MATLETRIEPSLFDGDDLADTAYPGAERYLPPRISLSSMRQAVQGCRGCPLYKDATQAVFGRGKSHASLMLVGEVPGDKEDLEGRPFVGPAGVILREALGLAGIHTPDIYVTNAVKHFKFLTKGFKRFHKKPDDREIKACRPWVMKEIEVVKPTVLVCLGATAAQSLLGKQVRITRDRGRDLENALAPHAVVTWHPSAILRMPSEDREMGMKQLVKDLTLANRLAHDTRSIVSTGS